MGNGVFTNDDSAYFATGAPVAAQLIGVTSIYVESSTGTTYFTDGIRISIINASGGTLTVLAGLVPSATAPVIDGGKPAATSFLSLTSLRAGRSPQEIIATDAQAAAVYRVNFALQRVDVIAGPVQVDDLTKELTTGPLSPIPATSVVLPGPYDAAVESATGDIYVGVSSGNVVAKISARDASLDIVAGTGKLGCYGRDSNDATSVPLAHPTSVYLDGHGGLIIADRRCCLIRLLDLFVGSLSIIAGVFSAYMPPSTQTPYPPTMGDASQAIGLHSVQACMRSSLQYKQVFLRRSAQTYSKSVFDSNTVFAI